MQVALPGVDPVEAREVVRAAHSLRPYAKATRGNIAVRLAVVTEMEPFTPSRKASTPVLEEHLCFALYAAANAMSRAHAPLLAPFELTYPQYLVLLVLWEGDDLSIGELGLRLYLNSATFTPLLKRLEKEGMLTRRRGTQDKRKMRLLLTKHGRALEADMSAVSEAIFCSTALSQSAVTSLRIKLRSLHHNLTLRAASR